MKLLIFSSTWEWTQQRIYVNVTTRVRNFEINCVIKPIKMYTLVKIHSHVPNLTEFIYKIVLTLSIWENTREKPYECSYCGKTLDQNLNLAYFEKLTSDFKTVWRFEICIKSYSKKVDFWMVFNILSTFVSILKICIFF